MGVINLYKGLESEKEIYNFNGKIKDNLSLNWEHTKILKGAKEIDPSYEVLEDDVILIQELHGFTAAAIILGVVVLGIGIGATIYAVNQAKKAKKDLDEFLANVGKQKQSRDLSLIPQLADARNEKAEGKNLPIILGRHLFAPYFLSDPYLSPSGEDGVDLYWYGTFLAGQNGLCFEKVRNGTIDLVNLTGDTPQWGRFYFQPPKRIDSIETAAKDPPFYSPDSFIEIVQKGNEDDCNSFSEEVFNEKWVDSLDSRVEIGRLKKDNPKIVDDIYVDDKGAEPVIRATARFPMEAEIEIFLDGLHGWDSEWNVATYAAVGIKLEWSESDSGGWRLIPVTGWHNSEDANVLDSIKANAKEKFNQIKNGITGAYIINRNKTQEMRFVAKVEFPPSVYSKDGKPVFIRATRTTKMHTGGYRDRVYLSAIRTKQYNPKKSSVSQLIAAKNLREGLEDKVCRLGIKFKVNLNTAENLDRFNIIASMTGRTWDGQWSPLKTKTSNPAAVLLEVLTGLIHEHSKYNFSEIDLTSLGKLYDYCQYDPEKRRGGQKVNIEGTETTVNLEANGVLTNGAKKLDVIKNILNVCDSGLYINEFGKLIVYYDDYQETPLALINPQRIVKMSENRSLARKTDGYKVEFVDQDADFTVMTYPLLRPRVQPEAGLTTYSPLKLDYITSYYHAMWYARRMMAKDIHRPGDVKISVGKEGRHYKPGSLIKVQHERFKIGLGSGEIAGLITEGDSITGLRTMEMFDISGDRDYWVEYYVVDENRNHVVLKQIQSVGKYTDLLMFTVPLAKDSYDAPVWGNILSTLYGEKTGTSKVWESKRYLVSNLSENADGYDLTLVQYHDIVYQTTTIDEIPEYSSSILNSPPRVYEVARPPIDGESGQGQPDMISITNVIAPTIALTTPRYRGAFYTPDLQNTGTIGGVKMNRNDWVAYLGTPQGIWREYYCYRWNGEQWVEIPMTESEPYMAALADITRGAPLGVFSQILAGRIMALEMSVNVLQAQHIILQKNEYSRGEGGIIQSYEFDEAEKKGWAIYYDGRAFFKGVEIDATSITVNGMGYLPLHFVYFRLPGQEDPNDVFSGRWENRSQDYAGVFFRVDGGNALRYEDGGIQGHSIAEHEHMIPCSGIGTGSNVGADPTQGDNITGWIKTDDRVAKSYPTLFPNVPVSSETRPINMTIQVFKKVAN
jgi:hypothetical protein